MKAILIGTLITLSLAGNAYAIDWKNHPNLKKAHELLEQAKKAMAEANDKKKSEFGGHRASAMSHVDQAQKELEQAAEWADNPANK
jgi:hypothetical protein